MHAMLQEQGHDGGGVPALHPQCLCNAPPLKSVVERCSHDMLNNILFFIEGAYLKLTGDEQLLAEKPVITEHGFEYFATRTTTLPCAACKRHMETGLIARLLEKAAAIPHSFDEERIAKLARREGVYRPKRVGQVIPKDSMSHYFRNHCSERAELMTYLEEGEQKRQTLVVIYTDDDNNEGYDL